VATVRLTGAQSSHRHHSPLTSYVIHALVQKRPQLSGDIENTHERLKQMIQELERLDKTLLMFGPNYQVESIKPKAFRPAARSCSPPMGAASGRQETKFRPRMGLWRSSSGESPPRQHERSPPGVGSYLRDLAPVLIATSGHLGALAISSALRGACLSRCLIVSLLGVTMSRKLSLTQSAQSVR
jgi:hypothetical protein